MGGDEQIYPFMPGPGGQLPPVLAGRDPEQYRIRKVGILNALQGQ